MTIVIDSKSQIEEIQNILSDKHKFLGEFSGPNYALTRSYILGDGKQLRLSYTRLSPTKVAPTASVCIVHGLADHSGPFIEIAYHLCMKGLVVHLIDIRGFGYSGGPRGCSTLHQILLDIGTLISQVDKDLPLFLYGHCLGALCALLFALLNPHIHLAGIICTSPLLAFPTDGRFTWLRLNFLRYAGKVLEVYTTLSHTNQDLVINSLVNPTALTKKTEYIKDIIGDRLAIPFIGLNMASSLIQGVQYVKENANLIKRPILILHGKDNTVVNYNEVIFFYEKCGSAEKQMKIFDKGMHELQHDDESTELQAIVCDWIQRKATRSQALGALPSSFNVRFLKKKKFLSKRIIALIGALLLLWHLLLIYKQFIIINNRFKRSGFNLKNKLEGMRSLGKAIVERFTE